MSKSIKVQNRTGLRIRIKPEVAEKKVVIKGKEVMQRNNKAVLTLENGQTREVSGAYATKLQQMAATDPKIVIIGPELTPAEKAAATKKANAEKKAVEEAIAKELAAEEAAKKEAEGK